MSEVHEAAEASVRKTMSPEHKAKMAAGREAAKRRRAAEAKARTDAPKPVNGGADYDDVVGGAVSRSGGEFALELAAALSEMTHASRAGKTVAPAVQKRRDLARRRLVELIEELRETGEIPVYELTQDFFSDDVLIPALRMENGRQVATRIRYAEIPNEGMEPKNESARRVMALFLESIGGKTPDLGEQTYEAYLNRPRVAQVLGDPLEGPPLLGTPRRIVDSKAQIIEGDPEATPRRYVGPRKVLGTIQPEIPSEL